MEEMAYNIGVILGLMVWPVVNYFVAHKAIEKNPGIKVNPILYALGAFAFGGLYTLLFLGGKVLWFRNKQKQNNNEMETLQKRIEELEAQAEKENE